MNHLKEEQFSKVIKAGTKRTYFIDVKESKNGSVFLQFSESLLKLNIINYERISNIEQKLLSLCKRNFQKGHKYNTTSYQFFQ